MPTDMIFLNNIIQAYGRLQKATAALMGDAVHKNVGLVACNGVAVLRPASSKGMAFIDIWDFATRFVLLRGKSRIGGDPQQLSSAARSAIEKSTHGPTARQRPHMQADWARWCAFGARVEILANVTSHIVAGGASGAYRAIVPLGDELLVSVGGGPAKLVHPKQAVFGTSRMEAVVSWKNKRSARARWCVVTWYDAPFKELIDAELISLNDPASENDWEGGPAGGSAGPWD